VTAHASAAARRRRGGRSSGRPRAQSRRCLWSAACAAAAPGCPPRSSEKTTCRRVGTCCSQVRQAPSLQAASFCGARQARACVRAIITAAPRSLVCRRCRWLCCARCAAAWHRCWPQPSSSGTRWGRPGCRAWAPPSAQRTTLSTPSGAPGGTPPRAAARHSGFPGRHPHVCLVKDSGRPLRCTGPRPHEPAAAHLLCGRREPQGPLLLLELESEEGCPAAASLAARVDKAAAGFASLRKQWSYRLARAAVDSFQQRFAAYRCALRSPTSPARQPAARRQA
jgi:hypothetical protein